MKNVIFDWSGVVKDAVHIQLWIINKVFVKHGLKPFSLEEFKQNWEQPHELFYKKYLPNLSLEEEAKDYREAILSKECPASHPYPGVVDLIKNLKKNGLFLTIVSSDIPETILKEIKDYGLEDVFSEVITDVNDKLESISSLMKKHSLDPEKTYFIGDSNHEAAVAKKFGIKSVSVTWGFSNKKVLKAGNPDFLVNDLKTLEEILL